MNAQEKEIGRLKGLIKAAERAGPMGMCPWCRCAPGDGHRDGCPAFTTDGEVKPERPRLRCYQMDEHGPGCCCAIREPEGAPKPTCATCGDTHAVATERFTLGAHEYDDCPDCQGKAPKPTCATCGDMHTVSKLVGPVGPMHAVRRLDIPCPDCQGKAPQSPEAKR